ncbi:MAG: hypothetical protein VKJ64_03915 [Leptolyngbyaceae bacterium]|nr:hypothetical protein [Leptolyngbyaceae bacterium]
MRCTRNRNRSKRRAIYCPQHNCYLDSVSQKYRLFADQAHQLQERGVGRRQSLLLIANQNTVSLTNEWLEAFWCPFCHETTWYHVKRGGPSGRTYTLSLAPAELWQQVDGVQTTQGNPTVSQFTRRQSRRPNYRTAKDFKPTIA